MSEHSPICPICDESALEAGTYTGTIEHAGQELQVSGLEYWECPTCGADPVFPDQARRNHLRFQDARRRADGLLTGDEIAVIRRRHDLTQADAAKVFGGGANAFSKYERGDVIQSKAMDRLLRLAAEDGMVFRRLQEMAGLRPSNIRSEERCVCLSRHDATPPVVPRDRKVVAGPWTTKKVAA